MEAYLNFIRLYLPAFGLFKNRLYDECFTIVVSSFVAFIIFGYIRQLVEYILKKPDFSKEIRCHFCEENNPEAIVDLNTELCRSCGQLNAFEDDGDYSRPLPELVHPQLNKSRFGTPSAKRGHPVNGSPQPNTAPTNLMCNRCIDNQEKIVALKAKFIPSRSGDDVFSNEFADYSKKLEQEFSLCEPCFVRIQQFVGEQDKQIAATIATSSTFGAQNRLFMANGTSGIEEPFVPSSSTYRRNKVFSVLTLLSTVFPLIWGPFDLSGFWFLRMFANFLTAGFAIVAAITSQSRRIPLTPIAVSLLFLSVLIDFFTVSYYLKLFEFRNLSSYQLKLLTKFSSAVIEFWPIVISALAFTSAVSVLPDGKKRRTMNRQISTSTFTGSPTQSEPYVQSLFAETVRNRKSYESPWRAFSSSQTVYSRSNYSPMTNGSPGVTKQRPLSIPSKPLFHIAMLSLAAGSVLAYVYYVL